VSGVGNMMNFLNNNLLAISKKHTLNQMDLLALLVIISTILFPPIKLDPSFPSIRIEEVLLFILFPLLLLVNYYQDKKIPSLIREDRNIMLSFIGIFIIMMVSTVYGGVVLNVPLNFGDLNEFLKPVKFAFVFFLFSQITFSKEKLDLFIKFILVSALMSAFIGILQFINFLNINYYVSPFYTRTAHQLKALVEDGRISSTFGNPIVFGGFMMIMSLLSLSIIWGKSNKQLKKLAFIGLPFFLILLVLTKSRAPIMLTGASIIIMFFILQIFVKGEKKTKLKNLAIFIVSLVISGILFFLLSDDWAITRFQRLLENPEKDTSLMKRVGNWVDAFNYFLQSPILGWGPATATMSTWVENDYLFILRRYGIIGFVFFMMPVILVFTQGIKLYNTFKRQNLLYLNYIIISSTIALAGYMMILYFYHELQLTVVYWIFAGMLYSVSRYMKSEVSNE
jgi:O-antigen ligase